MTLPDHAKDSGSPHAHIDITVQDRASYRALIRVAQAAREAADSAGLDRTLVELVNLRVSQMNGCAACLDAHSRAAIGLGETVQRIALLPAWREAAIYSDAERAALSLAEALTSLPNRGLADDQVDAADVLSPDQVSAVTWVVIAINSFNRVSIASHHPVRDARDIAARASTTKEQA